MLPTNYNAILSHYFCLMKYTIDTNQKKSLLRLKLAQKIVTNKGELKSNLVKLWRVAQQSWRKTKHSLLAYLLSATYLCNCYDSTFNLNWKKEKLRYLYSKHKNQDRKNLINNSVSYFCFEDWIESWRQSLVLFHLSFLWLLMLFFLSFIWKSRNYNATT